MKIREISTPKELEQCFSVIKELRPHLSYSDFLSLYDLAKSHDEYKLLAMFQNDLCIAVLGYRILFDFVHGKHLYIDDLVVTESSRSKGLGKQLLQFVEIEAQRFECKVMRLCTGVKNVEGIRFYEKNEWESRAIVFKKKTKIYLR